MVDAGWIYTSVQAAAAFVAITAGFFTTKILSISSEKRTVANQISLSSRELQQRESTSFSLKERIDEIEYEWAEETVTRELEEVTAEVVDKAPDKVPSKDEVRQALEEKIFCKLDEYDLKALDTHYPDFVLKVESEQAKRRQMASRHPLFSSIGDTLDVLSKSTSLLIDPERAKRRRQVLDELYDKYSIEKQTISLLRSRKEEFERHLKGLSFPRYVWLGFFTLILFAGIGIVIPLYVILTVNELTVEWLGTIFVMFITGLSAVFVYLFLEIDYSMSL